MHRNDASLIFDENKNPKPSISIENYQNAINPQRAPANPEPKPILHVSNPVPRNLGNVQESQSFILDGRGARPIAGNPPVGIPNHRRETLNHTCARLFRYLGQNRPRKPCSQIHERSPCLRGPCLLQLPNCHREHPLRNVLAHSRNLHKKTLTKRAAYFTPLKRCRELPKGRLGLKLYRQLRDIHGETDSICLCGRDIFLGQFLRDILVKKAWVNVRANLLKRANLARRRTPLRFRVLVVQLVDEQIKRRAREGDSELSSGDKEGVCVRRTAVRGVLMSQYIELW